MAAYRTVGNVNLIGSQFQLFSTPSHLRSLRSVHSVLVHQELEVRASIPSDTAVSDTSAIAASVQPGTETLDVGAVSDVPRDAHIDLVALEDKTAETTSLDKHRFSVDEGKVSAFTGEVSRPSADGTSRRRAAARG